ncbi:MAG: Rqc2 family fibronectin-binding protein [Cellulosilyticaceae bacterium]
MALDGIVLSNIVHELKTTLLGGRIDKIYQPEKDELVLTARGGRENFKLLLTANSSYPRLHLTTKTKASPATPPMFCMLLRKHLISGKIVAITQPHFERIVELHIEAMNELGDREPKKLIIEIMGRHSNIILTKEDYTIIDSIKHISADKSSVRTVLPGRPYVYPPNQHKTNPLEATKETFLETLGASELPLFKALYTSYSGLSPAIAQEMVARAQLDPSLNASSTSIEALSELYKSFSGICTTVKDANYTPALYTTEDEAPVDFYSLPLTLLASEKVVPFSSVSELIEAYYHEKSNRFVVSQKTSDIKKLLLTFIDRAVRKQAIQQKAIEESMDCEQDKIFGELLTAYSYAVPSGSESFTTTNYYTEPFEDITIPLQKHLTAIENAQKYFKRYNKAKRTLVAAKDQLSLIEEDLSYLHSVLVSLDFLQTAEDIEGLKKELTDMGYLKKRKQKNMKAPKNPMPYMQFKSSTGYPIFVGKNNYQNDELTMKFAKATDLWLHIKDGPGSHVIVRLDHQEEIDDVTLVEAALIAAYYSKGKFGSNVAIDYTLKKNVKKIPNAKPGMVIYNHFNTIYVTPDEPFIKKLALN